MQAIQYNSTEDMYYCSPHHTISKQFFVLMTVRAFDLQSNTWSPLKTYGKAPVCICFSFPIFDKFLKINIMKSLAVVQNLKSESC